MGRQRPSSLTTPWASRAGWYAPRVISASGVVTSTPRKKGRSTSEVYSSLRQRSD